MSDKIEMQGKTVENAVSEALLQMGARKDEVKITVLEEPRSGFLGILGNRQARVLVERKTGQRGRGRRDYRDRDDDHSPHDLSGGGQSRSRRGRGRRSGGRSTKPDQGPGRQGEEARGGRNQKDQRDQRDQKQSNEARSGGRSGGLGGGGQARNQSGSQSSNRSSNQSSNRSSNQPSTGSGNQPENQRSGQRSGGRGSGSREQQEGRSRGRRDQQDRQGRSRRPDQEQQGNKREAATVDASSSKDEAPNNNQGEARRGGDSRGGNSNNRSQSDRNQDRNQDRPDGGGGRRDARSRDRNENQRRPSPPVDIVPDTVIVSGLKATSYAKPIRNVTEAELDETMCNLTTGLLVRAGFPSRCEVKEGEYRQVRVITGDDSAGMLIGRHGSTVDAVEHLIERMMGVAAGDRVRMNLDINNYRRRREEVLVSRVAEAVERVKETERDYHMEPMCARERRLIHLESENYESIRTYTLMRSGDKHVVIALDKADSASDGREEKEATSEPVSEETPAVISSIEVMMDTSLETADQEEAQAQEEPTKIEGEPEEEAQPEE